MSFFQGRLAPGGIRKGSLPGSSRANSTPSCLCSGLPGLLKEPNKLPLSLC